LAGLLLLLSLHAQGGQLTPIDLIVEEHFHRAAPGGMGGTKAAGNYSPVLVTQLAAKKSNYAGVCNS
jgi:branched-chain amino acid aminotransferase